MPRLHSELLLSSCNSLLSPKFRIRCVALLQDPYVKATFFVFTNLGSFSLRCCPAIPRNMFWTIGCIYGASSVALGAFGAHGLKKQISDPARLANWGTAAQYQVHIPLYILDILGPTTSYLRVPWASTSPLTTVSVYS